MPSLSLFATLVQEREPPQLAALPEMFQSWVQVVGGFAAFGLVIWCLAYLLNKLLARLKVAPASRPEGWPVWQRTLFAVLLVTSMGAYGLLGYIALQNDLHPDEPQLQDLAARCWPIAGGAALLAVLLPIMLDILKLRFRRILAIAKLSWKEALHSKALYIFTSLLIVLLFADWFLEHKAEDQLRSYVQAVYSTMGLLLLLTAVFLASFGLPADIRDQTIHTVVTKPVERFEIVLGRFLGYTGLLSAVLLVMTCFSLLYVWIYGVHPDARSTSLRARVPIYGESFAAAKRSPKEWDYRLWIAGGPISRDRAVWTFTELPTRLQERKTVPCEFAFDIFRLTKGEQNRGIYCTLAFQTHNWSPDRFQAFQQERERERNKPNAASEAEINDALARKYGYFEYPSKEISNLRTYTIDVPVGLFENARRDASPEKPALLYILVKCESPSQYLGAAKHDLYFLDAEGFFALNFFKGIMGLWFRLCLVVGVAVACSTYLSGVVSLLTTASLYMCGLLKEEFLRPLAEGQSIGGGPAEAALRIIRHDNLIVDLKENVTTTTALQYDAAFRWFLKRFLSLVPDIDNFDLTRYVAEGFDISVGLRMSPTVDLLTLTLLLVGYLLPWAVLAYYLMRARELAA